MKRTWVIMIFSAAFLIACQPSAGDINSALLQTQAKWTAVPSQSPYPTYTPYPTQAPYPTFAPISTSTPAVLPDSSQMTAIPAGEFLMGCDPWDSRSPCQDGEAPSHQVYLDSYAIDLNEVSNAQYARCVAAEVCRPPNFGDSDLQKAKYSNPVFSNHPITNIDWHDARDYCTWVGKRLPSEAEWEKAARGDQDELFYPWGDGTPDCSRANFDGLNGDCIGATSPVEDFQAGASPYGLLNMAGNVREWVADWYDANYYMSEPQVNPQGPDTGSEKAIRGGSHNSDWIGIRVNARSHNPPVFRQADLGFRCARDS